MVDAMVEELRQSEISRPREKVQVPLYIVARPSLLFFWANHCSFLPLGAGSLTINNSQYQPLHCLALRYVSPTGYMPCVGYLRHSLAIGFCTFGFILVKETYFGG